MAHGQIPVHDVSENNHDKNLVMDHFSHMKIDKMLDMSDSF